MTQRIALLPGLTAPSQARAWLAERAVRFPALLDDALLIVSELVTNAVQHGSPEIVLDYREVPGGVRVAVADGGAAVSVERSESPDLDRPNGRGLLIVAAMARAWGVEPHSPGPGKTVWAELGAH